MRNFSSRQIWQIYRIVHVAKWHGGKLLLPPVQHSQTATYAQHTIGNLMAHIAYLPLTPLTMANVDIKAIKSQCGSIKIHAIANDSNYCIIQFGRKHISTYFHILCNISHDLQFKFLIVLPNECGGNNQLLRKVVVFVEEAVVCISPIYEVAKQTHITNRTSKN